MCLRLSVLSPYSALLQPAMNAMARKVADRLDVSAVAILGYN